MKSTLLALLLVGNALSAAQEAKPAAALPKLNLAIVGPAIEVGNGKRLVGTVVIRDGKIAEVREGEFRPEGVPVLEAKGKTLYPGFIDGFTARGVKTTPNPSEDGRPNVTATAPATMWIGNRKGISPEWRAADNLDVAADADAYKAGLTTALISPGRGSLRGIAAVVDLLPATETDRVLVGSFGVGMSFRGGTGTGYPSNILGIIALMRQTLADAQSVLDGAPLSPGEGKKPSWMASLDALQPLVRGQMPAVFEVALDREILRAFRLGDEFGFKSLIAGGRDSFLVVDELLRRGTSVLLSPSIGTEPANTAPPAGTPASDITPEPVRLERIARWNEQSRAAEVLAKAGVPFAFSSEGDTLDDFLKNVRLLVKRGLPRETALKALTQNAAKILGLANQLGTIEVGKRANLVLMNGDFAEEKTEVERVWIGGRVALAPKEAGK